MEATGAQNARLGDPFTGSANWGLLFVAAIWVWVKNRVSSKRVALRNGTKD